MDFFYCNNQSQQFKIETNFFLLFLFTLFAFHFLIFFLNFNLNWKKNEFELFALYYSCIGVGWWLDTNRSLCTLCSVYTILLEENKNKNYYLKANKELIVAVGRLLSLITLNVQSVFTLVRHSLLHLGTHINECTHAQLPCAFTFVFVSLTVYSLSLLSPAARKMLMSF